MKTSTVVGFDFFGDRTIWIRPDEWYRIVHLQAAIGSCDFSSDTLIGEE